MGDYGLKISLPGHDVGTATLQQIAFSSKYPLFKIGFSGSLNITVPSGSPGTTNVTFSHNLNYIPAFKAYGNPNSNQRITLDFASSFGGGNTVYLRARMTTTQLIIYGENYKASSQAATIYYYIFIDPGT